MERHGFCVCLLLSLIMTQITSLLGKQCNLRFYEHYEQKNCKPVMGLDNCPVRFECEPLSEEDMKTCVSNGKRYKLNEAIENLGACNHCTCSEHDGSAFINCAAYDCGWKRPKDSCYWGWKPDKCCGVEICPTDEEKFSKTCDYMNETYKVHQSIYTPDPCISCICTEDWIDERGPGCTKVPCATGTFAPEIRKGCLPLYHTKTCCLIGTYCNDIKGAEPVTVSDTDKGNFCEYKGLFYEIGSIVHGGTEYQCLTCNCTTPPDFTCLESPCP